MLSKANTTFKITKWEEESISELTGGGGLRRAHITKSYEGELQGDGIVEYLMAYKPEGSASFTGYEVVTCVLNGKSGSFVFEHRGKFKDGVVDSTWSIAEGSGSGELAGIRGEVYFKAGHQAEYAVTLEYEL